MLMRYDKKVLRLEYRILNLNAKLNNLYNELILLFRLISENLEKL